jgi:hypothetical protein
MALLKRSSSNAAVATGLWPVIIHKRWIGWNDGPQGRGNNMATHRLMTSDW